MMKELNLKIEVKNLIDNENMKKIIITIELHHTCMFKSPKLGGFIYKI